MSKPTCTQFIDRFYAFIDEELSAPECAEIQQHLDSCPECFDRLKVEARFISWFKKSCRCETAPSHLAGSISSALEQAPPN